MTALTQRVKQLSPTETDLLDQCEEVIAEHLNGWIEVANALEAIKANRLYRRSYATFEDYCQGRWSFSGSRARQLMIASGTVTNVTVAGLPAPENEGQARALGAVPVENQADVWRATLEDTGGKPTAAAVRAAADRLATVANPEDHPSTDLDAASGEADGVGAPAAAGAGVQPSAPATNPGVAAPVDSDVVASSPESGPAVAGGDAGGGAGTPPPAPVPPMPAESYALVRDLERRAELVGRVVEALEELMEHAADPARLVAEVLPTMRHRLAVIPRAHDYLTRLVKELDDEHVLAPVA